MENKGMPPPYALLENSSSPPNNQLPPFQTVRATRPPVTHQLPPFQPVRATRPPVTHSNVIIVNTPGPARGCPVCHNNSWTGTYSLCAWLCCIFCFPCGIICCCCMREKKCTKCGFVAG